MSSLSWTRDNDHVWGPFLFCRDTYKNGFAFIASSGDGEEYTGATLRISLLWWTFILALPQWLLRPHREKVEAKFWDAETIERLGRDWYWSYTTRKYGFYVREGHFVIHFGRYGMDSRKDQSWSCFLPWTQWRHVRHSFYAADGSLLKSFFDADKKGLDREARWAVWNEQYEWEKTIPTVDFEFDDYDGERLVVRTKVEEREWRFGDGWFKWLSWFRKPKIHRSLDLSFSGETGRRKGSWKGGTIGASIEIEPGEEMADAFKRYCLKKEMTFVGELS